MAETSPAELLEGNRRHSESLPVDHFDDLQEIQRPRAVSMCCSDSRVGQQEMWSVEEPGWLFTPSTIGNQVWDVVDGRRVVDGSILYPLERTETTTAVVVGHTGCGAIEAAIEVARDGYGEDVPAGLEKWIDLLVPVVEDGLADPRVDPEASAPVVDQLAEYNVDRQVEFLMESEDLGEEVSVYGFVYDLHGVYGGDRGRAYLVNVDGDQDVGSLACEVSETMDDSVVRLLDRSPL